MSSENTSLITPEEFGSIFHNEDYARIYYCTTKAFQDLLSLEQFIELAASFNQGVNHYQIEFSTNLPGMCQYVWIDDQQERAISVIFGENQEIQSLLLKPYVIYPESDKRYTQNTYTMPVKGEWFVFWGGANELINYHYAYESQRYAYDLVQIHNGLSYKNTPISNEHYYAYNQEIIAPADGTIVKVTDGLKDNVPGEMDANNPAGNYVIIEHENNEYSLLAHFKQSSIQVKEGDIVKEGQCIGLCGNSGNSSEPHLHFQVMDSAEFISAKSIRIRFADGIEPIQGDLVSNV